jgi:thiamine-phosphate pyrophosphorylase
MSREACRLYLITPPRIEDLEAFAKLLEATLKAGDVACLQLRLKDASDDEVRKAIRRLKPIAQAEDVAFILNDRPDLALETDCDGVHVGQEDAPYAEARRILGTKRIVGVTCHDSRHLAMEAGEAGADYVAFGAFYPTTTKEAKSQSNPEILSWWSSIATLPCVAIGGITAENAKPLVDAGADFLAVSAGVWNHPDGPIAAVSAFERIFKGG